MKTKAQIEIEPVYDEHIPDRKDLEQNKIYISEKYKIAVHLCLCGCGHESVTPLTVPELGKPHNTKAWELIKYDEGNIISISPSILNSGLACKSHYVITKNIANIL